MASASTITGFRIALFASLIGITVLAVIPMDYPAATGFNDKLNHLAAFYVLAFLSDFSFQKSGFNRAKVLSLFFYGLFIEWIQYYLPFRECSLLDVAADAAGILLYMFSQPALKHIPALRSRWETNESG